MMTNWFFDLVFFLSTLTAFAFLVSKSKMARIYLGVFFILLSILTLWSHLREKRRVQTFARKLVGGYVLNIDEALKDYSNFDQYEGLILTVDEHGMLCFNKEIPFICGKCGKWKYVAKGEMGYAEVVFENENKEQFGSTMGGGIIFRYPTPCEVFFQTKEVTFERITR